MDSERARTLVTLVGAAMLEVLLELQVRVVSAVSTSDVGGRALRLRLRA